MNKFIWGLLEKVPNKKFDNRIMDKNMLFFDCQISIDSVKKYNPSLFFGSLSKKSDLFSRNPSVLISMITTLI
jgi:hypothetical protein